MQSSSVVTTVDPRAADIAKACRTMAREMGEDVVARFVRQVLVRPDLADHERAAYQRVLEDLAQ